ncbi:MAG: hypothetical protein HUJ76_05290 [Parasporobacterium sp.]|nr:hypothetical protein [Parasporobacterium sp.]
MFIARFFLIPYIITIVVEITAALIWGVRSGRSILAVLWINTITNPAVSILRLISYRMISSADVRLVIVILAEIAVLLAEWKLFSHFISERKPYFLMSLTLNGASYGAGLLLPVILTILA